MALNPEQLTGRELVATEIAMKEGGLEYIIDVYGTPNFVDVVGRKGGDTITLRVMNDGQFYER